ncbi:hypothetical protein EW145_g7903, partial [Phellinidium pouzarii]
MAAQSTSLASLDKALRKARIDEYPKQSSYLLAGLIVAVALYNLASIVYNYLVISRVCQADGATSTSNAVKDEEKQGGGSRGTVTASSRVSIRRIPLALLNSARVVAYRVTVPVGLDVHLSLAEIFIPIAYVLALLIWEFVRGQLSAQYWADRAGTLAASKLVFIVALSGKNNIISLLTGISYEKLSILHRVAARTLLLLVWIHLWGRWSVGFDASDSDSLTNGWLRSGIVAGSSLSLLVVISNRKARQRAYELFVLVHNVLVFLILVCVYFHVRAFPPFVEYVWPAFIVWGLDRLLRFARVMYIYILSTRSSINPDNAQLELLSSDAVRVTVRVPSSRLLAWKPGQHAFLTIPSVSRSPLEAHPFTIASLDSDSADGRGAGAGTDSEMDMTFIVRARTGFTRRLFDYADRAHAKASAAGGAGECRVRAYVDGPYGSSSDANVFPNVILVAAHMSWISKELGQLAETRLAGLDIDIRIFVTRAAVYDEGTPTLEIEGQESEHPESAEDNKPSESEKPALPDNPLVTVFRAGRASAGLLQLLEEEIG